MFSQVKFQKILGRNSFDTSGEVVLETDSSFYMSGTTTTMATGYDMCVTKFNKFGDTIWSKNYGGTGLEYGGLIKKAHDGNFLCVGQTLSFGSGNYDTYIVKINPLGDTLWTKAVGSPLIDLVTRCIILPNDDFILLSSLDSTGFGNNDVQFIKMDANGNVLWNRLYDAFNDNEITDILQSSDSGFILTGSTNSFGAGDYDSFVIKVDSLGNLSWAKTYGGILGEGSFHIVKSSNGYAITGNIKSFGQGGSDVYLLKLDLNGNIVWAKTYGTSTDETSTGIALSNDNGFAISGNYGLTTGSNIDVILLKADSLGNLLWTKKYGSASLDFGGNLIQTADNGYFIPGSSISFTSTYYSDYFIKTDSLGNSGCYENNLSLITMDITSLLSITNPTPNVYSDPSIVAINTQTIISSDGLIESTLCFTTDVKETEKIKDEFNIYPNPANNFIDVETEFKNYSVSVFDDMGNLILKEKTNQNKTRIDLSSFSNGIYFIQLQSNDKLVSKKFIKE